MITTHKYGSSNYRTFAHFLSRSFAGNGIDAVIPNDLEIRFTEKGSQIFDHWDTETLVDVPFELWHVGIDPSDPSDDYQLTAWMLDADGNTEFNLCYDASDPDGDAGWADHGVSGGSDDPYTDRLYWMAPVDDTPGTQGYDKLIAALAADPTDRGGWNAKPGSAPGDLDAWAIVTRMVLVNWNGGNVKTAQSPDDYDQAMPETGTVFRISMTKPNSVNDVFSFSTPAPDEDLALQKKSAENVGVFPNPYYAFNPQETHKLDRFVTFNNLPPRATIRIFNLAGHLVRVLEKDDPTQFIRWNLLSSGMLHVASGMYICHVDMPDIGVSKVVKLAIIQEAEVLEVY
jgi:hypothetical protein